MQFKIVKVLKDFNVHLNEDDTACVELTFIGEVDGQVWPHPCKLTLPCVNIDITPVNKEKHK